MLSMIDNLLKVFQPTAKCTDTAPSTGAGDDAFMSMMDPEAAQVGGGSGDFKSALEYRNMAMRRPIFSTEVDKIEGFRFSITTPISGSFLVQNKWVLFPQQSKNKQQTHMEMMSMMPEKSSHYELDMYYIHNAPTDQMAMMSSSFDQGSLTHFRGSLKASGVIEAMIMKKISRAIDLRFEGQFQTPEQSQWSLTGTHTSKLNVMALSLGNLSSGFSTSHRLGRNLLAGFEVFYMPTDRSLKMNYAALWRKGNRTLSGSINHMSQSATLGFLTTLDRQTQIGAEISYNMMESESKATLAYQKNFKKSIIKGVADSTGRVQTCFTLGDVMSFMKFRTYASGNLFEEQFKFGYGIHIGMEEL